MKRWRLGRCGGFFKLRAETPSTFVCAPVPPRRRGVEGKAPVLYGDGGVVKHLS
jgi:hypothetical protein